MAITFEEKKKGINWFVIAAVAVVLGLIGLAVYFLFFSPTPVIEVIVPRQLESVAEISEIQFDPSTVINSSSFRSLKNYTGLPSAGQLGRENPFISF